MTNGFSLEIEHDVTIVKGKGIITSSDVLSVIGSNSYGQTPKAIWDLRDASLNELRASDLKEISRFAKPLDPLHEVKAVALLVKNEPDRLISKLFSDLAMYEQHRSLPHFAATSYDECERWLKSMVPNSS